MTTVHLPPRYDERTVRLALGVEARDAVTGARSAAPLRVLVEDAPVPLHRWRTWRPGESLESVLGGLDQHRSGRFARVYGRRFGGGTVRFRLVDTMPGRGPRRHIVPRRFEVELADETVAVAADSAGPPLPEQNRVFRVGVFPGAAAPVGSRATVVRGRVTVGTGAAEEPVRWARLRCDDGDGHEVAWAHGDDRGEFVLVLGGVAGTLVPDSPLPVEITVGASLPPPSPPADDPLRAVVDPLWDLPAEPLAPTADPDDDDRYAGRALLPGQATFGSFPFEVPLGREASVHIQLV